MVIGYSQFRVKKNQNFHDRIFSNSRFNPVNSSQQFHPIKYQPTTTTPNTYDSIPSITLRFAQKYRFNSKTQNSQNQPKTTKQVSLIATQPHSTRLRNLFRFSSAKTSVSLDYTVFNLKPILMEKHQEQPQNIYIIIHNNVITEFRTLTR